MNSKSLNLTLVRVEFDKNLDNEQNIDENDESSCSDSDVPVTTGGEGNESNMPHSAGAVCDVPTSSHID
jgi:hypothetical protein